MLTATEYELLRFLIGNPKECSATPRSSRGSANYDFGGQANVIDLYISYLRKQIDDGREPIIHINAKAGHVATPTHGPPTEVGRVTPGTARIQESHQGNEGERSCLRRTRRARRS
ncbi:MAG: two-component system response regulator [Dactylosporangium sp.]|nr:two-component system response regulator [Dactylosporangium sp.]